MSAMNPREIHIAARGNGLTAPRPMLGRPARRHPSRALRALVWLRRFGLDRALAEGADPAASPRLALRAEELTAKARRCDLARSIIAIADSASAAPRGLGSAAPLDRPAIRASRPALRRLAHDLCASEAVRAQGVARARVLLVDGASPLYGRSDPALLARKVAAAQDTLLDR